MAEVFVLSASISLKTLPGGTDATIEYGCVITFVSIFHTRINEAKTQIKLVNN